MSINIKGDGNAVGDSNKIFVNKKTTINNNNGANKSDDELPTGIAIMGGIAIAFAIATWKFAQFAPLIYTILIASGFSVITIKLVTGLTLIRKYDRSWLINQIIDLLAAIIVTIGIWMSSNGFGIELTQHALATEKWKTFFCGLSPYGVQHATYHLITMVVFAVPALMFLLVGSIGSVARSISVLTGIQFINRIASLQKRNLAIVGLVFAILCLVSQIEMIQILWAEWFESKSASLIHYVCK